MTPLLAILICCDGDVTVASVGLNVYTVRDNVKVNRCVHFAMYVPPSEKEWSDLAFLWIL